MPKPYHKLELSPRTIYICRYSSEIYSSEKSQQLIKILYGLGALDLYQECTVYGGPIQTSNIIYMCVCIYTERESERDI